ncbi:molybdenum cofactor biosysynthesis protein [Actinoplanes sp. OR16]|uniref:MOSC domain-containing protein n=1 Tax=Actinoplanes sp. OR16 TaxID=946334 RepID=UPI000F6DC83E|nr:MOSC domain-containing protein [Actinoplanes sp. OR16]BBH69717.1 molybdenum cofactor biosysynthesis protein [Actinoplanes sp. OR16]
MQIIEVRRYPVKSMLGEVVPAADVGERGLDGDRLWAVRDEDGKFGSDKNTRRFRRMPGLFGFHASRTANGSPDVTLPDGRTFAADDPAGHRAVSSVLGHDVTLTPEQAVAHHDEGPVSLITTSSLRALAALTGDAVEPLRFRANLLVDVPGSGFAEDDWPGRLLAIGPDLILRVVRPLTRCVMIDLAQEDLPDRGDLLKLLGRHHDLTFGVVAAVERPGRVAAGDEVVLLRSGRPR